MSTLKTALKGSVGLRISLATAASVVGATLMQIFYQKPSGATGVWDAEAGEDGISVYYETKDKDDLDEVGDWNLQAYVENGWKLFGIMDILHIDEHIEVEEEEEP